MPYRDDCSGMGCQPRSDGTPSSWLVTPAKTSPECSDFFMTHAEDSLRSLLVLIGVPIKRRGVPRLTGGTPAPLELLLPEHNPPFGQIVGRKLHLDAVA